MALIKCDECGKQISDKANACPNCGNPINSLTKIPLTEAKEILNNFFEGKKIPENYQIQITTWIKNYECKPFLMTEKYILDCDADILPNTLKENVLKFKSKILNTYFDEYNKFLKEYNIKELSKNYSIEDLEQTIISLFLLNIQDNTKNPFDKLKTKLKTPTPKQQLSYLFKAKKENYYLLKNNELDDHYLIIIIVKYLLQKESSFIFIEDIPKIYSYNRSEDIPKNWEEFQIHKYTLDDLGTVLYINNFDKVKKECEIIKNETKSWDKTSKVILTPYINEYKKIIENLKKVQKKSHIDINTIIKNKIIEEMSEYGINIHIGYSSKKFKLLPILLISKYNLFYIAEYNSDDLSQEPIDEIYGSFSNYDRIDSDTKSNSQNYNNPLTSLNLKPTKSASVIGRSIVGGIVGGTTGSVIGAASAINENMQKQSNYKPNEGKTINVQVVKYNINIFLFNGRKKILISVVYNDFEKIYDIIYQAHSNDNLLSGYFAKQYLENHNYEIENMENIDNYINIEIRKYQYWNKHKEKKQEIKNELHRLEIYIKKLNDEISTINEKNKPLIDKVKKQYNIKLKEETTLNSLEKELADLNQQLSNLTIFKISEKRNIKQIITEKSNQISTLNNIIEEKRKKAKIELNKQINKIEKEKTQLQKELNEIINKKEKLIYELTKER